MDERVDADSRHDDDEAIKTYRYLRIGLVGLVVLLAAAVAFERFDVDCWQTSVSAYYYTPVRAVLVGALIAVGVALIVLKGSTTAEDACLNVAGMLAPVVAFVPTADAGRCWSVQPEPLPIGADGSLAPWVVANIDNNMKALLLAGALGLVVAVVAAVVATRSVTAVTRVGSFGTRLGLGLAAALIVVGFLLFRYWDDFDVHAHSYSAIAMFAFLALAILSNAVQRYGKREPGRPDRYFLLYLTIFVLMVLAAAVLFPLGSTFDHMVLVLEITEIVLFAAFWVVQTVELWNRTVRPPGPDATQRGIRAR